MNKLAYFILLLIFPFSALPAQQFLWGESEGGPDYLEFGLCVDTDADGNVYMIGEYQNGAIIGGNTYFTMGNTDQMVVKYDPYGNFQWVRLFGGTGPDRGYALSVGTDQHIYVAGYGKYYSGWKTGSVLHSRDATMLRLRPDGSLHWGHAVDGDVYSEALDVEADAQGNSYFTGLFKTEGYFGNDTIIGNGQADVYFCAFDSSGNLLMLESFGSSGEDHPLGIGRDAAGNIYIGGYYSATFSLAGSTLPASGGTEGFVAKFSPSGMPLWARPLWGPGNSQVDAIAVSPAGEVSLACRFADTLKVSGNTLVPQNDDICIARYDSVGNLLWLRHTATPSFQFTEDIERDRLGNLYISGFFYDQFSFDTVSVASGGIEDGFLLQIDSLGQFKHLRTLSGPDSEFIFDIWVDKALNVYTTGSFIGNMTLGPDNLSSVNLTHDIFTAKYGMPASLLLDSLGSIPYCANEPFTLHFTPLGGYDSLNTFIAELSDDSGNFASAQAIGSVTGVYPSTIACTIPGSISSGSGYRVRVRATHPATVSPDNGFPINLVANSSQPVAISGDTVLCAGDTVTLSATAGFAHYAWNTGDTTLQLTVTIPGTYTVEVTDSFGCGNSASQIVTLCVGLEAGQLPVPIRVYPNPAQDHVVINYGAQGPPCDYSHLLNMNGQRVRSTYFCPDSATSFSFDLRELPNGVYFLRIPYEAGFHTEKIVIQRR